MTVLAVTVVETVCLQFCTGFSSSVIISMLTRCRWDEQFHQFLNMDE